MSPLNPDFLPLKPRKSPLKQPRVAKSEKVNKKETASINEGSDTTYYSATRFKKMGVIYWGKYKWTWYSQKVLPGKGLKVPGRHVDDNGYVCDNSGYICLASCDIPKGTVINTPFGKQGKIYDYQMK